MDSHGAVYFFYRAGVTGHAWQVFCCLVPRRNGRCQLCLSSLFEDIHENTMEEVRVLVSRRDCDGITMSARQLSLSLLVFLSLLSTSEVRAADVKGCVDSGAPVHVVPA